LPGPPWPGAQEGERSRPSRFGTPETAGPPLPLPAAAHGFRAEGGEPSLDGRELFREDSREQQVTAGRDLREEAFGVFVEQVGRQVRAHDVPWTTGPIRQPRDVSQAHPDGVANAVVPCIAPRDRDGFGIEVKRRNGRATELRR